MSVGSGNEPIVEATTLIESLAPGGFPVPIRTSLVGDECVWFLRAVVDAVVRFTNCPDDCFRVKKWGVAGPDHFTTPHGKPRHLFSKPIGPEAWLNREYVPHIAAYAKAVLQHGYDPDRSSFSLYRTFSRDLLARRAGGGYETDAEFYAADGSIFLQIEAKASQRQTEALARAIERHGALTDLPESAAKEVEYVLDLAPNYLWVVGPGSVDPATHVYKVELTGPTNAVFIPQNGVPRPSEAGPGTLPGAHRNEAAWQPSVVVDETVVITSSEAHLDLLLAEELSVNQTFVRRFIEPIWAMTGDEDLATAVRLNVWDEGGEGCALVDAGENDLDVVVTSGGRHLRLLIEDKVWAEFQPGQCKRYWRRATSRGDATFLVAPRSRLDGAMHADCKHVTHAIEDLAGWLVNQADSGAPDSVRLRWKAAVLRRLCTRTRHDRKPDHPPTVAFSCFCANGGPPP